MEYQSDLFMNFTCGSKAEKKGNTVDKWMTTNEFTIDTWLEYGSDARKSTIYAYLTLQNVDIRRYR